MIKSNKAWIDIVNACRITVSKPTISDDNEVSSAFKQKLLISEHSVIRLLTITWDWIGIKSWVATHWVRHKWECFVSTKRTDRTGVNRDELPQDTLVDFMGNANSQNLIDTMLKRLCYQSAAETRVYAEGLKANIREIEPELAFVLVPNCIYRGGCPEMKNCGFYDKFIRWQERQEYGEQTDLVQNNKEILIRYE